MKEINMEVIHDAAHRLLFDMSESGYEMLLKEFDVLIQQMETIGKIEGLEDYEPMTFPFDCTVDVLREDIPETPLPRDEALKNAGNVQDHQIKLPKVVL